MSFLFSADDFGFSSSINEAIQKAHQAGILQAASLAMGQDSTQEAVQIAKHNPELRVGLHLVVTDGKSVLPKDEIPNLVDENRQFPKSPAHTWLKYFFQPYLRTQLFKEIRAQFHAFAESGLKLSHVDGHHHQHVHPLIFKEIVKLSKEHGAQWVRIPIEKIDIWKKATTHYAFPKLLHGLLYYGLTAGMRSYLRKKGFFIFDGIFGFLDTYSMTPRYVTKVLEKAPAGNYEIYFHPGADWNHDLDILLNPDILKASILQGKIFQNPGRASLDLSADNRV